MNKEIQDYNKKLTADRKEICNLLADEIQKGLSGSENKIWHGSPVWFLNGNPIAGYSNLKDSVQLLFWSGQSFDEADLEPEGSFKASQKRYTNKNQINVDDLQRWLEKSKNIQWDYKNIVKRKGNLERLK